MLRGSLRIAERERPVIREYKYTPLEDPNECIRLISFMPSPEGGPFRAEIFEVELCDAPSYRALSYTWGVPSDALKEIEICLGTKTNLIGKVPGAFGLIPRCKRGDHMTYFEPQRFLVSPSLESAIRGIDALIDGDVAIWIDALCIDQSNDMEKGYQVLSMDRIYRRADSVYIWLGEEAEESDLAMELLQVHHFTCGWGSDKEKDPVIQWEEFEKKNREVEVPLASFWKANKTSMVLKTLGHSRECFRAEKKHFVRQKRNMLGVHRRRCCRLSQEVLQ